MADVYKVRFLPRDRVFPAEPGETLLETAMRSGVHINASCGGNGACGKCRIRIKEGQVDSSPSPVISETDYDAGVRLACRTRPLGDVTVEIPFESQVDRVSLKRRETSPRILSAAALDRLVTDWSVNPSVFKEYVELVPPSAEDNMNDLGRLIRELKKTFPESEVSPDLRVVKKLATTLRGGDWRVTATLDASNGDLGLINLEPGNTVEKHYSIAIDIGTTTVWGQILDLSHCRDVRQAGAQDGSIQSCVLGEAADYNGQISYGEDVISRIMYAQKEGGLDRLKEVICSTINGIIRELFRTGNIDAEFVSHVVLAGNTTMTHLIFGVDPKYLMLSPYVPAFNALPPLVARDLGLEVGEHALAYVAPCVASYVGGDIVAGVLASGIFQRDEIALFMDIGTNGEIVVGSKDWLTCTSCSAGPAFEGGGIMFGMRAGNGAIEQVSIDPSTYEPMILTIGRTKPAGICGSGLIDAAAEFFDAGIIDRNGRIRRDLATNRVREGEVGWEYVLAWAEETQIGRDIALTEADLDNLIRAKAAVYAGCRTLLGSVGLTFDDVDKVIIAGGFGRYLNIERAQTIGLLPDVAPEKFVFIGNGSLLGARLMTFSRELLKEAGRIARSMTNIELSSNPSFMNEFMAALFLPHTDDRQFPHVMELDTNSRERNGMHA